MANAPQFYIGNPRKGYFECHEIQWKDGTSPVAIELACFREKIAKRIPWNYGEHDPMWHFKTLARAFWPEDDPDAPVKFIWNRWADWMLYKACEENYLAIAGCAGLGKSEFFAIWLIIQFLCDPENTLCMTTSKTMSVSKMKMWGKIVMYWNPLEAMGMPGKLVDSLGRIRYVDNSRVAVKGDLAGIALIPSEKKKEKEAVGSIIGIHPKRAIFVADDLTELSEAVTEAAFNNLSMGCEYFQFVGLANPLSYFDSFGKFAKPVAGWDSINVEEDEWKTDRGVCIHFDATKNPRITDNDDRLVWMLSQADVNEKIRLSGEKSASFWRMVRGFWCPEGVVEYVYSEIEIITNKADQEAVWLDNKKVNVCFLDPAYTHGGDRCVAYFGTYGKNHEGFDTLEYTEYLEFHEDITNKEIDRTRQAINWWKRICFDRNVPPSRAAMDSTGAGQVFLDDVHLFWSKDVTGINFGGKATDKAVSVYDPTPSHDRYGNRCTEIWYAPKEAIRTGQIRGLGPDLIREMCMRKKRDEKTIYTRIFVQSKKDMKLECGFSPDIADAGLGLAEFCREKFGFNTSRAAKEKHPQKSAGNNTFKKLFSKFSAFKNKALNA